MGYHAICKLNIRLSLLCKFSWFFNLLQSGEHQVEELGFLVLYIYTSRRNFCRALLSHVPFPTNYLVSLRVM